MTRRTDNVRAELDRLVNRGVIAKFDDSNPTGNKLEWNVTDNDGDEVTYGTPEAEAFANGANLAASALSASRGRQPNPQRDAIERDGYARVDITGMDESEVKKARNKVFAAAYTLGLKGSFKVKKVSDGELIGYRTDVAIDDEILSLVAPKTEKAAEEEE